MEIVINRSENNVRANDLVKELYSSYARKLHGYTLRNYTISEDDAWNVVYRTIYRIAETYDKYSFEDKRKENAFVFKTHINYLRNYYRDNKTFEHKNREVNLHEGFSHPSEEPASQNSQLILLQKHLDALDDWERILLLMRSQEIPYSEIAKFVNRPEKQLKVYYSRLKKELLQKLNAEMQHLNELKNGKK